MKINEKLFKNAVSWIKNSNSITIIGHINPDGDCVGSCMALYYYLTSLGKKCAVFADGDLKGSIVNIQDVEKVLNAQPFDEACDLIITADVSSYGRLGEYYKFLNRRKVISVDHHETHELNSEITFLDAKAASCTEFIYELLCAYNENYITDKVAYCLYVGLVTDSGNFAYNNVRAHTFEVAAKLLKYDIKPSEVSNKMMKEITLQRFRMHTEVKYNAEYCLNGQVVFAHFSQEIFDKYGLDIQETDGVASALNEIDCVKFVFVLSDFNNKFKVSCRSKLPYKASDICEKFGGGGHATAAGCIIQGNDYFEACDRILAYCKAELNIF